MAEGTVLITGGAGFIGSHLTDALLAKGHSVRILDDLSTGKRSNLPLDNPRVELIVGDVADAALVAQAMQGCSAVAHLAAVASVQASVDDPVKTHQSNFIGTLNVCEAMRQAGVKRVLYASSAAVYGNNGEGESIDEDTPKAPLTPYASDKLAGEHYFDFYRRQHGLEPVIFRFFNIFGPRQDPSSPYSGVISIFSERAQKGLPITVFGDGEQTRDFLYVEDLVDMLVQAIEKPVCRSRRGERRLESGDEPQADARRAAKGCRRVASGQLRPGPLGRHPPFAGEQSAVARAFRTATANADERWSGAVVGARLKSPSP